MNSTSGTDALVALLDSLDRVLLLGLLMLTEKDLALGAAAQDFADDVLVDSLMKLAPVTILIIIRYFERVFAAHCPRD